jgi:alpha-tubulin suppressor-like RCC1 family protein
MPPITYGELWSWGLNNSGQLGDGTSTNRSSPVQTVAGGTNWQTLLSGYNNSIMAAIKTDGTLWTWGLNLYGTLGDGTSTNRSSPVQTVAGGTNWQSGSGGSLAVGAIKTDGTLWMWGFNNYGELGDNSTTYRSSPVQTVAGGTNWSQVAAGYYTGAIKTDGTLWMWGKNTNGELGDNTRTHKSSPVQTVAGGTNWSQVAVGANQGGVAAIKTDGTLWMWGVNSYGQLGTNNTSSYSSPVQTVAGGTNWSRVAVGLGHTIAVKTDGTLWTWGGNNYGQLGLNDTTNRSSPVQIYGGGTNWSNNPNNIAAGLRSMGAIKTDGTLWIWGANDSGGLGIGSITNKSSPTQVGSLNTWQQLHIAQGHTSAIKTVV